MLSSLVQLRKLGELGLMNKKQSVKNNDSKGRAACLLPVK